jgi:hypothetical protein
MSKYEDSSDKVLDRLNEMREELVSIERSLERIQAAPPRDSSGAGFQSVGKRSAKLLTP